MKKAKTTEYIHAILYTELFINSVFRTESLLFAYPAFVCIIQNLGMALCVLLHTKFLSTKALVSHQVVKRFMHCRCWYVFHWRV